MTRYYTRFILAASLALGLLVGSFALFPGTSMVSAQTPATNMPNQQQDNTSRHTTVAPPQQKSLDQLRDEIDSTDGIRPFASYSEDPRTTRMTAMELIIPSLHLNAAIEAVGQLDNGEMGVPTTNPMTNVGLYKFGPRPGDQGSAVIDGHVDGPGGVPAVFWNLKLLRPGDIVEIQDGNKLVKFQVIASQAYLADQAPLAQVFAKNDGHYLNLITCAGIWIPQKHETTKRLVVYTKEI